MNTSFFRTQPARKSLHALTRPQNALPRLSSAKRLACPRRGEISQSILTDQARRLIISVRTETARPNALRRPWLRHSGGGQWGAPASYCNLRNGRKSNDRFQRRIFREGAKIMLKIQFKIWILPSAVIFAIFTAVLIILCALTDLWIIMLFELMVVLTISLVAASPYLERKKTLRLSLPKSVVIDSGFISVVWENGEMQKPVSDVKKVMKQDDCYHIILRSPKLQDAFCEAACMTEGSVEEFERLFQGKIEEQK